VADRMGFSFPDEPEEWIELVRVPVGGWTAHSGHWALANDRWAYGATKAEARDRLAAPAPAQPTPDWARLPSARRRRKFERRALAAAERIRRRQVPACSCAATRHPGSRSQPIAPASDGRCSRCYGRLP
jgi:hypothetical protein